MIAALAWLVVSSWTEPSRIYAELKDFHRLCLRQWSVATMRCCLVMVAINEFMPLPVFRKSQILVIGKFLTGPKSGHRGPCLVRALCNLL